MVDDPRKHLIGMLDGFDTAVLVTHRADGRMRARPMSMAEVRDDGSLYFCTGLDSEKVRDIEANPDVSIALQGKTQWVWLAGQARVSRDRALIHALWRESWKVWFPSGKDDPNLCLVFVAPDEGEYWDNSGTRGLKFAVEALKAYVRGRTPDPAAMDENAKVTL